MALIRINGIKKIFVEEQVSNETMIEVLSKMLGAEKLTDFAISGFKLNKSDIEKIIPIMNRFTNLRTLELSVCSIDGEGLEALQNLEILGNIEDLNLNYNKIGNNDEIELQEIKGRIQEEIDDKLHELASKSEQEKIRKNGTNNLIEILRRTKNLRKLSIDHNYMNNDDIKTITASKVELPFLESVIVQKNIDAKLVENFIKQTKQVQTKPELKRSNAGFFKLGDDENCLQ